MSLFETKNTPVFLKENSDAQSQLNTLRELESKLDSEGQAIIRQDIKNLEYGIIGEKNIAFELKNSHMPIYILHDVYLESDGLSAQIDYLVFTKKLCFVIECKNLYGNIEITDRGDFIRTIEYGGKIRKEGIYSPITQNRRHLELMKKLKKNNMNNFFTKFITDYSFEDLYKSIVVLSNPKTVLNAKYAKKSIRQQVIRADQLIQHIKDLYNQSKEYSSSNDNTREWAQSFLNFHKDIEKDYTQKYEKYKIKPLQNSNLVDTPKEITSIAIEETPLFKELKNYRLKKSKEEQVKPYFIYNNNQLKDLISKMPRSKEDLLLVSGFGQVKADKYGNDILEIVKRY